MNGARQSDTSANDRGSDSFGAKSYVISEHQEIYEMLPKKRGFDTTAFLGPSTFLVSEFDTHLYNEIQKNHASWFIFNVIGIF